MSTNDVVNTLTMSLSFLTVWITIIMIVAVQSFREKVKKKKDIDIKTHSILPDSAVLNDDNRDKGNIALGTTTRQTFLSIISSLFASNNNSLGSSMRNVNVSSGTSVRQAFRDYIISYFPSIYQSEQSLRHMLMSILTHHQYFSLLLNNRSNLGIYLNLSLAQK